MSKIVFYGSIVCMLFALVSGEIGETLAWFSAVLGWHLVTLGESQ